MPVANQQELIYNSLMQTQDLVWKTAGNDEC